MEEEDAEAEEEENSSDKNLTTLTWQVGKKSTTISIFKPTVTWDHPI